MRRRILIWLVAVAALAFVAVGPAAGTQKQTQAFSDSQATQAKAQILSGNPNFRVIGDDVADSPAEIHAIVQRWLHDATASDTDTSKRSAGDHHLQRA